LALKGSVGARVVVALIAVILPLFAAAAGQGGTSDSYSLQLSLSSDRSGAVALEGTTVAGLVYVFSSPDTADIQRVRFWLDNPAHTGAPFRTENGAPYDFNGGNVTTATAFNTATIADGPHSITAEIQFQDSSLSVITSNFTVQNTTTSPGLGFNPTSLTLSAAQGAGPVSQSSNLTATSGSASFTLAENASWLSVSPSSGTTPANITFTANPAGLAPGTYTTSVTASASGYTNGTISVSFTVARPPDQIHLAWIGNAATTLTVVWRTWDITTPSTVEYRQAGAATWQQTTGARRTSGTTGTLHQTTLTGLAPATGWEYRVRGDAGQWSPTFTAHTAPLSGEIDFVYVADTGLVGRLDGLATGTQQVVDEIASRDPLFVLGGGDYAYYNTDQRYGTLENSIDAWFNQMQPVAASAPLMPTYGNHEILLSEGYAPWAARFPTPTGIGGPDNRQNYSFDVAGVHFVSIMAVSDTAGLPQSALDWIDADLQAARTAGKQWLIPFFHATPFGDGTNHASNPTLRGQLAPIFERHGVKIALASQDQAYERSYPLTGVTAGAYTITSPSRRCYTMQDGVTWAKVSPGGKLSNENGSFSHFPTNPPPSWTAYRDNTMHHFAHVTVSAVGALRVDTYGVKGDGSPIVLQDSFSYQGGTCAAALELDHMSLGLASQVNGGAVSKPVRLTTSNAGAPSFTVTDSAPWLSVAPASGFAPSALTVTANPAGLAPGVHTAVVTVQAPGYAPVSLPATLTVGAAAPYSALVSLSSSRSAPTPLNGASVSGNVYVFTSPDGSEISAVRFYLDDPNMLGSPRRRESNAPYDFVGGTVQVGNPFDTRTIANGSHTISAAVELAGGGEQVVHATFTVQN
jgi:purple acid phosphatase-like protein/BACON domain-containing protein/calcineurin-like phosphoesterase family protein